MDEFHEADQKETADRQELAPPPQPPHRRSPARQRAYFLRQFERCGKVTEAAARTGVTPRTVQRWRARDRRFAERYQSLVEWRLTLLEDVAYSRARNPTLQPRFWRGRPTYRSASSLPTSWNRRARCTRRSHARSQLTSP